MTLDTETPLGTAAQIVFEHSSGTGVMTGNTAHRLKVPGVENIITDRMSKLFMPFMAVGTELHRPLLEHHRQVRAVQFMTVTALPFPGMVIEHLLAAGEFILMTAAADFNLINRRQPLIFSRMGVMTVKTEILTGFGQPQMSVRFEKGIKH